MHDIGVVAMVTLYITQYIYELANALYTTVCSIFRQHIKHLSILKCY